MRMKIYERKNRDSSSPVTLLKSVASEIYPHSIETTGLLRSS